MTTIIQEELQTKMESTLRELGINRHYKGYPRILCALRLALEDEGRLFQITQRIYRPVARQLDCDWTAVERSFRTIVHRAWKVNPALLAEIAGYPLPKAPTCSEFIEILTVYLLRSL